MEEIQKDIAFALMVNESIKTDPALASVVVGKQPYIQFILETQMQRTLTPEEWFADKHRAPWANEIRAHRQAYEARVTEDAAETEHDNAVAQELEGLKEQFATLAAKYDALAEQRRAEPEPAPEPEPEPEKPEDEPVDEE
jgi:hypothetical protein